MKKRILQDGTLKIIAAYRQIALIRSGKVQFCIEDMPNEDDPYNYWYGTLEEGDAILTLEVKEIIGQFSIIPDRISYEHVLTIQPIGGPDAIIHDNVLHRACNISELFFDTDYKKEVLKKVGHLPRVAEAIIKT